MSVSLKVRPREDGDIAACIEVLAEVHRLDGYPTHWPLDPVAFIAPDYEIDAWVAHVSGSIAGHVALHDAEPK